MSKGRLRTRTSVSAARKPGGEILHQRELGALVADQDQGQLGIDVDD
jgi:hypothetical protein